jgi:hypothetical protein
MRTLVLGALLGLTTVAAAGPLTYSNIQYSTSAFAEVGTSSDGINSNASPPDLLPLFSSASVIEGDEFALADGIADDFFLTATTEASSSTNLAGAVAEAAFEAELSGDGFYRLILDFDSQSDVQGGDASALMAIALSVGANLLFDESFTVGGHMERLFQLSAGESGLLSLNLISTADADGTYAFNLASVDVSAATVVPTPGSLVLALPGLLLAWSRRRRSGSSPHRRHAI